LNRPCETIWLDDPSADVQTGQLNAQKLIEVEKVIGLCGGSGSGTALAIGSVANRYKVPYLCSGNAAREITGERCNRYTFREGWTIPAASRALAPYMLTQGKRWYMVAANYVFGTDLVRSMGEVLKASGGTLLGNDLIPNGTVDFSSFMLKIRSTIPDVVVLGLNPGDMLNFLKQYKELGLDSRAPVASIGLTQADVWASGTEQEVSKGFYLITAWYYNNPNNTDEEKAMTKLYRERNGKPPSEKVWEGWYSMKILLQGIEEAKTTEADKVVRAIENVKLADGNYMRGRDHQMMQPFHVARINKHKGGADKWDALEIVETQPKKGGSFEEYYGSAEDGGCKMNDY
jgi:branched-chain amino acid transport system substrate-binding protein